MDGRDDLPDGVINAEPAGGWVGEEDADGETAERDRAAHGSPGLTEAEGPGKDEG